MTAPIPPTSATSVAALSPTRGWRMLRFLLIAIPLGLVAWLFGSESDVVRLEAAPEERSREHTPLDRGATQHDLGDALYAFGVRTSDPARLEEALAAYRAALEERTRERAPLDWATTQHNLGAALHILGEREGDSVKLTQAEAALAGALAVFTGLDKAEAYVERTTRRLQNVRNLIRPMDR